MNDPEIPRDDPMANASREEIMSALFANMVIQQTNMAMMLLGKAPHPESGQTILDLDAARMFIDQLQMIEAKTRGNLSKQEEGLLKQALSTLRMTYVEEIDRKAPASIEAPAPAEPASQTPSAPPPSKPAEVPSAAEESRKKFTKKY